MKWETEEVEAMLERIWDLHDKISDAILAISRTHFLLSVKCKNSQAAKSGCDILPEPTGGRSSNGFVFVKDFRPTEVGSAAALADAKSLNSIRTALEDFEDQLEFFHTVQSQHQAERDAAITRLEQSRIILAMRLADHHGRKHDVIKEALAFVGDIHDTGRFVSPEDICGFQGNQPDEHIQLHRVHPAGLLMRWASFSFAIARNSFRWGCVGGMLGRAAVFAVSMLALAQLQHSTFGRARESDSTSELKNLDVLLARG